MRATLSTRETLLRRVKDPSDGASWDEFSRLYRGFIYGVASGMGVAHHDAEDVVQSVLLRAWRHLQKFDYDSKRGSFRSWLGTVTCNCVRSYLTSASQRHKPVEDAALNDLVNESRAVDPELQALIDKEWKLFISDRAWSNIREKLDDSVRNVFSDFMAGGTAGDIAERHGLKENTVYVHRKRVVHRLQREIRRLEADLA